MVCYLSSQAPLRGSGQKKIYYVIRGGIKQLRSHSPPPQPVNCERSLSSLLDDIMNKKTFIRTVNLIFFFFQHGKPTKKKGKKRGKGIVIELSEIN